VSVFLFPDNTVLCNFAAVDRLDLLQAVLNGRGRWTATVAYEAGRSARFLPALGGIATEGWLEEPIEITAEPDVQRVNRVRRAVFGGTDDAPLKHLGEAETCFVIKEWTAFAGSWWISDDREALRYARFQGITTYETIDLMSMAVVSGDISEQRAFDVMIRMCEKGRSLRLPRSASALGR
jgi:predicted nucleic acid-binding protein